MSVREPNPVKQMRAVATGLIDDGRADEAVETLLAALTERVQQNAELSLLLSKLRASSRGATSENVSAEQLSLLTMLLDSLDGEEQAKPDIKEEAREDAALDNEIDAAAEDDETNNGPDGLTQRSNGWLYSTTGLAQVRRALCAGGVLSVWSVQDDPGFTKRLRRARYDAVPHSVRARKGAGGKRGKGAKHTVWIARCDGAGRAPWSCGR